MVVKLFSSTDRTTRMRLLQQVNTGSLGTILTCLSYALGYGYKYEYTYLVQVHEYVFGYGYDYVFGYGYDYVFGYGHEYVFGYGYDYAFGYGHEYVFGLESHSPIRIVTFLLELTAFGSFQLHLFVEHLSATIINDQLFPPICQGFADSNPAIREATIRVS